ncbi:MAG: hypothetical protein WCS87_08360 [Methylococcaceae bacterium]
MNIKTEEKDNYWLYMGGLVLAVVVFVIAIKSNEHDKYASSAQAISEEPAAVSHRSENK